MSTTTALVPLADYLATTYRPDCDYLEGEVRERNLGERSHSLVQAYLVRIFGINGREWKVWVQPEQRVQVRRERHRVPDLCVLRRDAPFEDIVTRAPLLCIEVLSPGDTLRELQERVDDYAAMGVEHIWTVDPAARHKSWQDRIQRCAQEGEDQPGRYSSLFFGRGNQGPHVYSRQLRT